MSTLSPILHPQHFRADLHEAKDLWNALSHLEPRERIDWLQMCCMKISLPGYAPVFVTHSTGEVLDVVGDFNSICGQNGLTLEWATGLAEHLLRGKLTREFVGETNQP